MRKLDYRLLIGALALLAGCQSAPDRIPSTPTAASPAANAAEPAAVLAPAPAGLPYTGYHRYRGTVGGRPVTVELTIGRTSDTPNATWCDGSYAYDRHPTGLLLLSSPHPYQPGQPLHLTEADSARPKQATGTWQATQPAGPVLTGTWRGAAGQQLPFSLREDYTDGQGHVVMVQYEMLAEDGEAPCPSKREAGESKAAYRARTQDLTSTYHQDFLHLLGPDTLRPALRRLQCPVHIKVLRA